MNPRRRSPYDYACPDCGAAVSAPCTYRHVGLNMQYGIVGKPTRRVHGGRSLAIRNETLTRRAGRRLRALRLEYEGRDARAERERAAALEAWERADRAEQAQIQAWLRQNAHLLIGASDA